MRRRAVIALHALGLGAALAGCAEPPPRAQTFAARLHARSPVGEPVAGTRFWANGRDLGTTQAAGELAAELHGRDGTSVELRAACPSAYRTQTPVRQLVLRRLQTAARGRGAPMELIQVCDPVERTAAVVVLARGQQARGLPIRVNGELVGQTDADGSAHLLWSGPPRSAVRVALDTSRRAALRPQDPVHSFALEDVDGVLIVEQTFSLERPPRRRPRPQPALRAAAPARPERIE